MNNTPDDATPPATTPIADDADAALQADRRAALAKLGLLAGYTAPAILNLLVSRRASSAESRPPEPIWP